MPVDCPLAPILIEPRVVEPETPKKYRRALWFWLTVMALVVALPTGNPLSNGGDAGGGFEAANSRRWMLAADEGKIENAWLSEPPVAMAVNA